MSSRLAFTFALLTSAILLAAAHPAAAQGLSERLQKGPIVSGTGERQAPRKATPPALPGTATGADRVSPADHGPTDLAPTDALFDSINRGDIVSARDALARGADFNARNVLGLTPLDQSIDLGRNDITFLLLSLRGSAPTPDLNPPATTGKPTRTAGKNAPPASAAAPKPVSTAASRPAVSPPRPMAQAQPANPGVPNPQSGFLGFGG